MPRKSLLAAVVAVLVSLALAPSAAAEKPIIEPAPFGEFTGQYCEDFLVRVAETTNRGTAKIFSDGSVIITGTLNVAVTNLETGKTISLNISGPAMFSSDGSTLVGVGKWLFFGEAGFLGRPGPTLETFDGRFTIDLGTVTFVRRTGTVGELCAALT
ncbi:MAG TPA: hypothetical protein VFL61_01360 [Gaiellaceae bacterium]|nr:hypothetical protein [Gaiellaceae bacterium]